MRLLTISSRNGSPLKTKLGLSFLKKSSISPLIQLIPRTSRDGVFATAEKPYHLQIEVFYQDKRRNRNACFRCARGLVIWSTIYPDNVICRIFIQILLRAHTA